jgi:hypothetical protein
MTMNKLIVPAIILVAAALILLLVLRPREEATVKGVWETVETGVEAPAEKEPADRPSPGSRVGRKAPPARKEAPTREARRPPPRRPAPGDIPEVTAMPADPEEALAVVDGIVITLDDLMPPGTLAAGEIMPREAYDKFLNKAIDDALLVGKAAEMGMADTEDFRELVEDMRKDLQEMPDLNEDDIAWRLDRFSKMALISDLYLREGLVPERVTREEVEDYYLSHGHEYDWVRKREGIKGSDPDRIERKVKEEIKRDLALPRNQEIRERREAYLEELRLQSDIRIIDR